MFITNNTAPITKSTYLEMPIGLTGTSSSLDELSESESDPAAKKRDILMEQCSTKTTQQTAWKQSDTNHTLFNFLYKFMLFNFLYKFMLNKCIRWSDLKPVFELIQLTKYIHQLTPTIKKPLARMIFGRQWRATDRKFKPCSMIRASSIVQMLDEKMLCMNKCVLQPQVVYFKCLTFIKKLYIHI